MALTLQASSGSGSTEYTITTKDGITTREIPMSDLSEVEDGEKLVKLLGYSQPFQLTHPEYGTSTKLRLLFVVSQGDDQGKLFSAMYGFSLGSKAKLTEVVEALWDRKIAPGEEVSFDELLGKQLYAVTKSELNSKGYVNLKVMGVRPYRPKKAGSASPAKPSDAALWDEDL